MGSNWSGNSGKVRGRQGKKRREGEEKCDQTKKKVN